MTKDQQEDISFQARLYTDPNPTRRNLHLNRKGWIEGELDNLVDADTRVLEIGVGCGIFTEFLSKKGAEIQAVDINQTFLDNVIALPGVTACNGDATFDLGFRDIDLVLCSEVVEHVPPTRSVIMLKEFYRALRPGGVVILTTPQKFASVELMARLFRFKSILWLAKKIYGSADQLGHINLMTRGALNKQIREAGLNIEKHEEFGFYLPFVAEFGGGAGASILQSAGRIVGRVPVLRGLLWTQAYVLTKPINAE